MTDKEEQKITPDEFDNNPAHGVIVAVKQLISSYEDVDFQDARIEAVVEDFFNGLSDELSDLEYGLELFEDEHVEEEDYGV